MRPGEWVKNLLVFAGLVFSRQFDEIDPLAAALLTFVAFCAISSAGYLLNDLRDVEHDRRHHDKRRRPIAAGELSRQAATRGGDRARRGRDRARASRSRPRSPPWSRATASRPPPTRWC